MKYEVIIQSEGIQEGKYKKLGEPGNSTSEQQEFKK